MIKKPDCLPGTLAIINEKKTKWNEEMGTQHNGLTCFDWDPKGSVSVDDPLHEILPGTLIEILSKPKRVGQTGVQVKFKIMGEEKLYAAWWICFLHKVDQVDPEV